MQFWKCLALITAMTAAAPLTAQERPYRDQLSAELPALMALYRDLHANPELSNQEFKTAAKLAEMMREGGFTVTEGVGGTGVVATLENGPGPTVLIRTDIDALPLEEQTGLPYASTTRGVAESGVESGIMHACAHDTHMAAWIGTARLLAADRSGWAGTLVMIAQPAEELGEGASAMLGDGLFSKFPKPDYALAFHNAAQFPAGMIGYVPGYAMANVDSVDIVVPGVGGHGAYPHQSRDPIVLAAAIVTRLQTLVSREINPLTPAVVTVGSFHSGTKHNIISDEARLQLTVRSYSDESRKYLLDGIARIAEGEAITAGMAEGKRPSVTIKENYTPAVYNSPVLTSQIAAHLSEEFGAERVEEVTPVMGGEDFSQYRRADPDNIQSLLLWIGGVSQDKFDQAEISGESLPSLHSPFYAPDAEKVIATAAEALASSARLLMARQ